MEAIGGGEFRACQDFAVMDLDRTASLFGFGASQSANLPRSTKYICYAMTAPIPPAPKHQLTNTNANANLHMALPLPIPPLRLFEIDDQSWFPASLRGCVQAVLTHLWSYKAPLIQPASPASLVARTLQQVLGDSLKQNTFVDFCSGAGGPTPYIEKEVNKRSVEALKERAQRDWQLHTNGVRKALGENVDFVMTDIHPHLSAWSAASKQSANLHFVPTSVDAANAPTNIQELANVPARDSKQVFRLFSLAFHHFPDPLAISILRNTLATSDGFAIVELQGRDVGSLFTIFCMWPLLFMGSWWWFWGQWEHLFYTYVVPIVPFVVVFDGFISCLRTRRPHEVEGLINLAGGSEGWRFETGREVHTWTGGTMQYFIGVREKPGKKSL